MRINWFKTVYVFIAIMMAALLIQYAVQVNAGGHVWKTGDWLINYAGGFVRRGFSGAVALFIADAFSVDVKWVVFSIQASLFIAFVFLVLKEFYQFKEAKNAIFWLLSPAFIFMFWINRPSAAFRKEILIYLSLVLFLKAFSGRKVHLYYYLLGLITYICIGLSHESVIFLLPYFVFPIVHYCSQEKIEWKSLGIFTAPLFILTMLIMFIAIKFKGSEQSINIICESLRSYKLRETICEGAISWLKFDIQYGYQSVVNLGYKVWVNYAFLSVLSFVPLLFLRPDRQFFIMFGCAILCISPLFIVAIDYGRWISMICTSTILSIIWLKPKMITGGLQANHYICFIYCFFWALPNGGAQYPGNGLMGRILVSIF